LGVNREAQSLSRVLEGNHEGIALCLHFVPEKGRGLTKCQIGKQQKKKDRQISTVQRITVMLALTLGAVSGIFA
jgi:hypothetical protein